MLPTIRRTQNWIPGIFNDFFGNEWMEKANSSSPALNILENEKEFKVEVAAPGMTKEDFDVKIDDDNNLVISVDKKSETEEHDQETCYLRREFSYSHFQRRMILPDTVDRDKISAKAENGILTINIPKREEKNEPKVDRTIKIK
ncbi:MAG: Hsp20/alpha crystallin family protein [Dysgonamonadaceae bacterium]|nr:Hsp20/alpha crystallin family protein [Dysgonamonadaceae bacterium]MDD4727941.1 Hsp20/alpha crystallin family protein [Dysgonamonadaceae bacterium]